MSRGVSAGRRALRTISDSSGLPHDEFMLLATTATVAAVAVGTWRAATWIVDTLTDVDARPALPPRA